MNKLNYVVLSVCFLVMKAFAATDYAIYIEENPHTKFSHVTIVSQVLGVDHIPKKVDVYQANTIEVFVSNDAVILYLYDLKLFRIPFRGAQVQEEFCHYYRASSTQISLSMQFDTIQFNGRKISPRQFAEESVELGIKKRERGGEGADEGVSPIF